VKASEFDCVHGTLTPTLKSRGSKGTGVSWKETLWEVFKWSLPTFCVWEAALPSRTLVIL
jgi:hypothetical protein